MAKETFVVIGETLEGIVLLTVDNGIDDGIGLRLDDMRLGLT